MMCRSTSKKEAGVVSTVIRHHSQDPTFSSYSSNPGGTLDQLDMLVEVGIIESSIFERVCTMLMLMKKTTSPVKNRQLNDTLSETYKFNHSKFVIVIAQNRYHHQ